MGNLVLDQVLGCSVISFHFVPFNLVDLAVYMREREEKKKSKCLHTLSLTTKGRVAH